MLDRSDHLDLHENTPFLWPEWSGWSNYVGRCEGLITSLLRIPT